MYLIASYEPLRNNYLHLITIGKLAKIENIAEQEKRLVDTKQKCRPVHFIGNNCGSGKAITQVKGHESMLYEAPCLLLVFPLNLQW